LLKLFGNKKGYTVKCSLFINCFEFTTCGLLRDKKVQANSVVAAADCMKAGSLAQSYVVARVAAVAVVVALARNLAWFAADIVVAARFALAGSSCFARAVACWAQNYCYAAAVVAAVAVAGGFVVA
jgi:hypothetical protein